MSRSSNRGPRADIALLRKLKADPNFSPSSLLSTGPNILEKANKLKGFVAEQRGKLGASTAKTEWLLAYQHLQGEQDDAERELTAYLQQLVGQQAPELREVADALHILQAQSEACRAERMQLRYQVKGLSSVHAGYKAYGAPAEFSREAGALKGEMSSTSQDLQATLAELTGEAQTLTTQLREVWPSALGAGGPSEGLGLALGLASVSGTAGAGDGGGDVAAAAGGYSRGEDLEELERMVARFPLASPDIKDRIREVFGALQDKYLERLETWRLEAEHAARDLTAGPSGTSATSWSATTAAHAARRTHQHGAAAAPSRPSRAAAAAATSGVPGGASAVRTTAAGERGGRGPRGAAVSSSPGGGSPGPPALAGRGSTRSAQGCQSTTRKPSSSGLTPANGPTAGSAEDAVGDSGGSAASELEPLDPEGDGANDEGGLGGSDANCGGNNSSRSSSAWVLLFSGYGGWSAEEHSAFVRHRDRLMKECGQGTKPATREVLMARIASLLPGGRSPAEVAAHDDWTTAARLLGRKRRDLVEGWGREARQFLEDSASFLQESETLFFAQAEEAAGRLVGELLRERARDELEELRAERARDDEVAAAERAARDAAEAEGRVAVEARERQQRAVQKDMIAAYRAELERQAAEVEAAAAEVERVAALAAGQTAEYNRERVEVRQAEYRERQELAKERQEAEERAAEACASRLARLRALVAPVVEADPARVLAPTAASAAERGERGEGAFHAVNGYTTDQVVQDQRFKLMEALTAVGLQQTDYGRRVIAAARPARPTRPDNFTSEQRAAMTKNKA